MTSFPHLSRRALLGSACAAALSARPMRAAHAAGAVRLAATPFPLEDVRLLPSAYMTAMEANTAYLMRLEPDRLLHNYRLQAGLPPKGDIYGGWESDSIAGHTLGHYMSALSLLHAQTGDPEARRRVDAIVAELIVCQARAPDGYVGGFTRKTQDGRVEPGRAAFEEVKRGDIRSGGFDLNGAWSPLYNWHKLFAGLLDAERYCGNRDGIGVATRLGGYIEGVFAPLDDAQTQKVLGCEYGGLNESFAELSVRTGDARWLRLAERIYDRKVLDPLAAGQDRLANFHSNTQIPKLIGLARLYEITGRPDYARASEIFWTVVTRHHSYVIGGNGDREYFQEPDAIASHITEQTCETCASYNMLKLTQQIYARGPRASFFDYYERTHLNHILAQQNPRTGMFAYMTPLMSGTARGYSTPFDDFWCCVGTGMESHAKHGEAIYWRSGDDTLLVNLFIPSTLDWPEQDARFMLETDYPSAGEISLVVQKHGRRQPSTIRMRIPGWLGSGGARLTVNSLPHDATPDADGYASITRAWKAGDRIALSLDLALRTESPPDAPKMAAILRGPVVLAADLGPADQDFDGVSPALVGASILDRLRADPDHPGTYRTQGIGRPRELVLSSFANQHERRSAIYFPVFSESEWTDEQARFRAEEARRRDLAARSTDVMHLGEMQAERDHKLVAEISFPVAYRGRNGRDARSGGFFAFRMRVAAKPMVLQATYWGEERSHGFRILVEGTPIVTEQLDASHPGVFFDREYPIPEMLTKGRESVLVRFEPLAGQTAGPVFGVACMVAQQT